MNSRSGLPDASDNSDASDAGHGPQGADPHDSAAKSVGSRKKRGRRMLIWTGVILAIWVASDWGYSRYVQFRIRKWEATFSRNEDGVRAGCEAFQLGDPESNTAILFIHGLNDSPACFRIIAPVLAEKGYSCHAIRLKGFAKPTPEYAQGTRGEWLEQIAAALNSLRSSHATVHMVAHSLGGALSIQHLIEHPDAADKLVLLAPGIDVSNARSPVLSARTWHKVSNVLFQFTRVTASPFGLDAAEVNDDDYPYRTPFTPRTIFDESFATIDALKGRESSLVTPVLLAGSRRDIVIDWDAAEQYVRGCGAEQVEIEYFDDSGHAFLVDHTAPRLAARIHEFLGGGVGESEAVK